MTIIRVKENDTAHGIKEDKEEGQWAYPSPFMPLPR